jgi:competence ComEA-like helix-hairpin-helix protein
MKQNPSRAKTNRRLSLVVAFAVISLSCARQPRHSSNELSALTNTSVEVPVSVRVNINTASALELEKLPGVGKIMAEQIVAYRQQYGPFRLVEPLMMVHGFSDHKFRSLRELITVE